MSPVLSTSVVLLTVLTAAVIGEHDGTERVVRTRQGAVRGLNMTSSEGRAFLAFYNLPYAKPPVGLLRFQAPQPPDPWLYVRNATAPGPVCTQNTLLKPNVISGTEDCLYLNVFTPEVRPKKPFPVMFWIYGGIWSIGGANWVEPGYLLNYDVILVTINYRIGPLGFLTTGDDAAPGNFGFKDMVAALKWVQSNIGAFGGNPKNVTIFGESAGGASVHYLMLSPLGKGLFQRAISQSGVSFLPWALPVPDSVQRGRRLASLLGCPTVPSVVMVQCLRTINNRRLTSIEITFREWFFNPLTSFPPAVEGSREGSFLPRHPFDLQPHSAIPWVVGLMADEGGVETEVIAANKTLQVELQQNFERLLPISLLYQYSSNVQLITKKVYDFYFPNGNFTLRRETDMFSDGLFNWKTDEAIRKYLGTAPVYYYVFSYPGIPKIRTGIVDFLRNSHLDDLLYFFTNNSYVPVVKKKSKIDLQFVKAVTTLWTNFASTGNPTPNNQPLHWPQVTSDRLLQYLDLDVNFTVKKGPFQERVDFWKSLPIRENK